MRLPGPLPRTPRPAPFPVPVIIEAGLDTIDTGTRVWFVLRNEPRQKGDFVLGLRAGDIERTTIRHLCVTLTDGRVTGVHTEDCETGISISHPLEDATCSGNTVEALFPSASLEGLGDRPRITAYSALNGKELQSGLPVTTRFGS